MNDFKAFMNELDIAGVVIDGRDVLIANGESAPKWHEAVTDVALQGRKIGVSFFRKASNTPSDQKLDHLLRGYPFSVDQRRMIIQNIFVRP
ncbi:MAG: hypothetical protein Q7K26_02225 [bacterium]|nr:hypothetical protein [bacterium]